ncbi:hypothetical protein BDD12DRAFT_889037 [Trichophaea hybrida]|nr:hypothetical protein BDD12DRAFT_889037 [Trichophaea hybrida]
MGILPGSGNAPPPTDTPPRPPSESGSCLLRHNIHCHPPVFKELDSSLRSALDSGFLYDVFKAVYPRLIQSLIQLEQRWTTDSPDFKLQTSISSLPVVPLESLKLLRLIHNEGNKVHAVIHRDCSSAHGYVMKTIERSLGGWKRLYHEIRVLLSIPPHPHIMPAPLALVSPTSGVYKEPVEDMAGDIYNLRTRIPICGFLMPYIHGTSLHSVLNDCPHTPETADICPCKDPISRQLTKVKWCRQLAEALMHILYHGNGPDRPGFYSDLKPDNILITSPSMDVLLLDFEQSGNRRPWKAPETVEYESYEAKQLCESCPTEALTTYKHFDARKSTPEHWNTCEKHWTWSPLNPANLPNTPVVTASSRIRFCHWWDTRYLDPDENLYNTCDLCPSGWRSTIIKVPRRESTPEHTNNCQIHWTQSATNPATMHNYLGYDDQNYYSNPPFGYYTFYTVSDQKAKEKAMVYSLGKVYDDIFSAKSNWADHDEDCEGEDGKKGPTIPTHIKTLFEEMVKCVPIERPNMLEVVAAVRLWEEDLKVDNILVEGDHRAATKKEDLVV